MSDRALKSGFARLSAATARTVRCGPAAGFTLVEILAAVAIIVMIVSLVYGSYSAASKSTQLCKDGMTVSGHVRETLGRMAGQIRCAYAPGVSDVGAGYATGRSAHPAKSIFQKIKLTTKGQVSYFDSDADGPGRTILRFVTTKGIFVGRIPADGLFEATYKFDKNKRILYFSQRRFAEAPEGSVEQRTPQPLLRNVESVELAFFDGQRWLKRWDFRDSRQLPFAVKVKISCRDQNHRQYHCSTAADIFCRNYQGPKNRNDIFVSAKSQ